MWYWISLYYVISSFFIYTHDVSYIIILTICNENYTIANKDWSALTIYKSAHTIKKNHKLAYSIITNLFKQNRSNINTFWKTHKKKANHRKCTVYIQGRFSLLFMIQYLTCTHTPEVKNQQLLIPINHMWFKKYRLPVTGYHCSPISIRNDSVWVNGRFFGWIQTVPMPLSYPGNTSFQKPLRPCHCYHSIMFGFLKNVPFLFYDLISEKTEVLAGDIIFEWFLITSVRKWDRIWSLRKEVQVPTRICHVFRNNN